MVQLECARTLTAWSGICLFQSHIGAIRINGEWNNPIPENVSFQSHIGAIRIMSSTSSGLKLCNFNPTLVQLESAERECSGRACLAFQSHIGAIRISCRAASINLINCNFNPTLVQLESTILFAPFLSCPHFNPTLVQLE